MGLMKKTLLYGGGLVLATTGPVSVYNASDMAAGVRKLWTTPPAATASANAPTGSAVGAPAAVPDANAGGLTAAIPTSGAAIPTPSIAEAFNFNTTIDTVTRRWPRVSTGLAQVQLQGYRVPLVTGTEPTALAGSLTYYFNSHNQVEQITFRGTTGDASALVGLLTSRFHFTRRVINDPSLILYEAVDAGNRLVGKAEIRAARVIQADQPFNRFDVDVTVNRSE